MRYEIKTESTPFWIGLDKLHNRDVLIKFIDSEEEGIDYGSLREISILRRLHHPNILQLLDMVDHGARNFAVFEFSDLNLMLHLISMDEINRKDSINIKSFCWQLFNAVRYIHHKGVIHRNLNPRNLYISSEGYLKIANFDSARVILPGISAKFTKEVILLYTIQFSTMQCNAIIYYNR